MAEGRSRQAAKEETRRALLEAGLAEIAEHGIDAPSLDAICARAGYTRGAFYVHFENREDFLVKLMDWVFSNFLDQIVSADASSETLEDVINRYLDALTGSELPIDTVAGQLPHVLEATQRIEQVRTRFVHLTIEAIERVAKRVLQGQQQGRTRSDVDAHGLAVVLVAASLGGMTFRENGMPIPFEPVREALLALLRPPS